MMQHKMIRNMQENVFHVANSFEPHQAPTQTPFEPDSMRLNDLSYGTEFPNSFIDLYIHNDSESVRHPTLIIVHGGGFCWCTKEDGEENPYSGDRFWFIRSFVKAGFNVVLPEYAYAPDYQYPTPIIQLTQAVSWLLDHADEHNLNMDTIVLNGGSAGGQVVGQFVNIQTNAAYAAEMGIDPVLSAEKVKALLFNSALIDPERFGKTGDLMNNWIFGMNGSAYFECRRLKGNPAVKQANVIEHMTAAFPPSFISDGNTGSFTDQNKRFAARMQELGIPHVLNLYPKKEKVLKHGFEGFSDPYGKDNMDKMITFLHERGLC